MQKMEYFRLDKVNLKNIFENKDFWERAGMYGKEPALFLYMEVRVYEKAGFWFDETPTSGSG